MGVWYHIFLKLLEPTSLCVLLLLAAAVFRKRKVLSRICFWLPVALLLVCGNGWVSGAMIRHLERRYPGQDPVPQADCILVLSGGTQSRIPPRPTIEVDDAGDRVLYTARLFRDGKAPVVICTGGTGPRAEAEDMAELLQFLAVPKSAILTETKARNTREHARNLQALLKERGFKRVLLVTSAMHMPRSMGVFKRLCPGTEFIPAPTDFRVPDSSAVWYLEVFAPIPTPRQLLNFSEAMHEYFGIAYYKLRGWM
jgi:uncharacterized SAM-binding protein YcdF (DUF218 family)